MCCLCYIVVGMRGQGWGATCVSLRPTGIKKWELSPVHAGGEWSGHCWTVVLSEQEPHCGFVLLGPP